MLVTQRDRLGRSRPRSPFYYGIVQQQPTPAGGGTADPGALSSPSAGAPTTDGTVGAGVTSSAAGGLLYWAVVTNGGSATNAQIIAGAGGNIVAGKAGKQRVAQPGAQTIATITGLTTATTYQILFLFVNDFGFATAQASVSLTTL